MNLFDRVVDGARMNEASKLVHRMELKNGGVILTLENTASKTWTNVVKVNDKELFFRPNIQSAKEAKHSAFNLAAMLNEGWEIAANE